MTIQIRSIIEIFYKEAKNINGVFDIIVRGTGSNNNNSKFFVAGWSDLDFSIIVENINSTNRQQMKSLNENLKKITNTKITVVLVDLTDLLTDYHLHGIKSFAYTFSLQNSESLLKGNLDYMYKEFVSNDIHRYGTFFYLSYLIHDLRMRHMSHEEGIIEQREFFKHLVKRTNHFIINAIFLKTKQEEVSQNNLVKLYPSIDVAFLSKLENIRNNWKKFSNDGTLMAVFEDYIFDNIEYLYSEVCKYFETEFS